MQNAITTEDLIELGFYKKEEGKFAISHNSGTLTLEKHRDVINWNVSYEGSKLFTTSYTIEKLTHLLKGLSFIELPVSNN